MLSRDVQNRCPCQGFRSQRKQKTHFPILGCVVGCAIGLPLSKSLYDFLIAGHFPSAVWQFPITSLGVILLFVSIAAIAAVYTPSKRIRNMSITATINEL